MGHEDRLTVIAFSHDASIALPFDGLSDRTKRQISFLEPRTPRGVEQAIAQSSVVVITREIVADQMKYSMEQCLRQHKPYYYYVDDNFWILKDELSQYASFDTQKIKNYIRAAEGIVVSTDALADFILSNSIHKNVLKLTPVLDRSLLRGRERANTGDKTLTTAFVGAGQRNDAFALVVEPAISRLWREGMPFRVVTREGNDLRALKFHGIPSVQLPVAYSFREYIMNWRRYEPDVLVHPVVKSRNAPFKTSSVILSACLLGAVPIVGSEPAFAGLSERDGVLLVAENSPDAWARALSALSVPKTRARFYRSLVAHCERAFGPESNEITVAQMLKAGGTASRVGHKRDS